MTYSQSIFVRFGFALLALLAASAAQADTFTVTCNSTSIAEGTHSTNTTNLVCTMRRTGGMHMGDVPWQITFPQDGTVDSRASASDFSATTGTLTFGAMSQPFTVRIVADSTRESDERFIINANAPLGHTNGAAVTVTITDDDGATFTLSTTDTTVAEGDTGDTADTVTFTITRSGTPAGSTDIVLTIAGGTGLGLTDFASGTATATTVTMPATSTTMNHVYTLAHDDIREGDETFTVAISGPASESYAPTTPITVTITDDDDDVALTLNPAPTAAAVEGQRPVWSILYTAQDAANTALAAAVMVRVRIFNNVPTLTSGTVFDYPRLEERVFGQDWAGHTGGNMAGGTAVVTVTTTVPSGTADGESHTIGEIPLVFDDAFAENIEHYRLAIDIETANAPAVGGGIMGNSEAFHTIAASDPLQVTVPTGNLNGVEGSDDVRKRITITREGGSPIAGGTNPWEHNATNIRLDYNDGSDQNIEVAWQDVRTNGYVDIQFGGDDNTPEEHFSIAAVTVQRIRSFNLNWEFTATPTPFSVDVMDDDPRQWIITARDGGPVSQDVAESATALTSPTTSGSNDDTMGLAESYLRFLGFGSLRAETTITYCLFGTATGGTAAGEGVDYIWPTGTGYTYNPNVNATGDHADCVNGRGTVIVPANHPTGGSDTIFRVPITLNQDDLNEGDETIVGRILSATVADNYLATITATNALYVPNIATRTIKDDDNITVSITLANRDLDPNTNHPQIGEGGNARLTISIDHESSGDVMVPFAIVNGDTQDSDWKYNGGNVRDHTITIPAGDRSVDILIALADDGDSFPLGAFGDSMTVELRGSGYSAAGSIGRTSDTNRQSAYFEIIDRQSARALTLTRYATAAARTTGTTPATGNSVTETDDNTVVLYYSIGYTAGDTPWSAMTPINWTIDHGGTVDADFTSAVVSGRVMLGTTVTDTADFTITIAGDNLNEAGEMFTVNIAPATADSDTISDANSVITINDNDAITLAHTGGPGATEGGNATVNITLGAIATSEITVAYDIGMTADTDDVDAVAADYTDGNTITIDSGQSGGSIVIPIIPDNLNEPAETFTVSVALTGVTGANGTVGGTAVEHTFTIAASDPVTASIAAPTPATVNEGGTATFTITLTGATDGLGADLTVTYTAGGTTDDPTVASGTTLGTFTIAAGALAAGGYNLDLTIPSSNTLGSTSPTETLSVALTGISGGGGGTVGSPSSATVTVSYQDAARTLTITGPSTIAEGTGDVESGNYTITLVGTNFAAATDVTWTVTHGGTVDGDFVAAADRSGTISFSPTDMSHMFTLTVDEDTLNEGDETFTVQASVADSDADNGTAFGSPASTTITDNADDAITVTIARDSGTDANINEGDNATFNVTLAGGVRSTPVVVPFTVTTSQYFTAADFDITTPSGIATTASGGTVTFPLAGATATDSMNIVVAVASDSVNEAAEVLALVGTAAGASGLRTAGAISYTTNGNSDSATIGQSDSAYASIVRAAGESGAVTEGSLMSFTMRIRQFGDAAPIVSDGDICVPFTTALTQSAMATNDATSGPDIELVAPNNVTCTARDTALTVPANGAVTSSVVIPAGQSSANFQIRARFDNLDEGATAETLTVSIPTMGVGFAGAGAVLRSGSIMLDVDITNINAARAMSIAGPAASVDEGEELVFTVSLSGEAVIDAFNVDWTVTTGGDAVNNQRGNVRFNAGDTMQTITLRANQDTVEEPVQTVTVTLTDPCPAAPAVCGVGGRPPALSASAPTLRLVGATANGMINASDMPISVGIAAPDPATLTEGTAANFTVSFTETVTTSAAVTYDWRITPSGDGRRTDDNDFDDNISGSGMIPAGMMSAMLPITAAADNLNEAAETFTVTISNVRGGGGIAAASLDNDNRMASATVAASNPISVSVAAPTAATNEGQTVNFTVSLTGATAGSTADITVTYTVTAAAMTPPGVAPEFTDAGNGELVIRAGSGSGMIPIVTIPDTMIDSGTGTLTVAITAVTAAADRGAGTVMASATNASDVATVTFRPYERVFSVTLDGETSRSEADDNRQVRFVIALEGTRPRQGSAVVNWAITGSNTLVSPGPDAVDADYSGAASGSLSFGSIGEQSVSITIVDDNLMEQSETLTFTIMHDPERNGGGDGSGTATNNAVTVTIADNDTLSLSLRGPATVNEERTATYTVDLGVRVRLATTVTIAAAGSGANPATAADYSLSAASITVPAGESTATFTLTATQGAANAQGSTEDTPDRGLTLTVRSGILDATVAVTITEDDPGARASRVEAPVVSVAQSLGQLASAAVGRRLAFVADGNIFNVGGQSVTAVTASERAAAVGAWAANPFERESMLRAQLRGGSGTSAKELLQNSSFALSLGGENLNLWGSGGRTSADGEVNNVRYDGDTTAWHIGADTVWNDGLLGIAVAQTSGKTDFTDAIEGVSSNLSSDITSVHPYIARNWGETKTWGVFGFGSGAADLRENNGVFIRSDLSVMSLAGGMTFNTSDNIALRLDGSWNRATLDGGTGGGRTLPKVSADALRINLGAEMGIDFTDELRPFVILNIRQDFGDGDDGSAADVGGGVEWNSDRFHIRLEGASHIQGEAANEDRLSLTARRQNTGAGVAPYARWNLNGGAAGAKLERGRFSLGMEVGVSNSEMEFKNLLSGELRF